MARSVALPTVRPSSRCGVLGRRAQEREVVVEHVLDAEEHVAEAGAPHQRGQLVAAGGDRADVMPCTM